MPQKPTVNDYTFYFVPHWQGSYYWKDKPGNIFRMTNERFDETLRKMTDMEKNLTILHAICNIEIRATGENTLVYDIFEDLRDKES